MPDRIRFGNSMLDIQEAKRGGLRWAVGSSDARRSSTWRLWGNKKGDIYVSARSLGGVLKASFHRDGRCHIGFTSEYVETAKKRFSHFRGRLWDKWTLPEAPIVRAFQVVIPEPELRPFPVDDESQMKWLPSPPPDFLSVVSVFIAKPPGEKSWPGQANGSLPVGVLLTRSRLVWVVHAQNPIDEHTAKWLEDQKARTAASPHAANSQRGTGIRGMMVGSRNDERFAVEIAWD
jgi:hypothetical protein